MKLHNRATYLFQNVTAGDAGVISCIAKNEAGEAKCEAQIAIEGKKSIHFSLRTSVISCQCCSFNFNSSM